MNREINTGGGGGGNPHACASCRHQRKKCDESCELAPYFPASRNEEFQHAQKLFGISNIQKIINSVAPDQRKAAAESILMEANIRYNDPVHGCLGVVRNLHYQIQFYQKQIAAVNQQLTLFREREKQKELEKFIKSPSSSAVPPPLPLTPSVLFQNEFDVSDFQASVPYDHLPEISDLETADLMYNYQSTLEEGVDIKPFDIQAIDHIMDPCDQTEDPVKQPQEATENVGICRVRRRRN